MTAASQPTRTGVDNAASSPSFIESVHVLVGVMHRILLLMGVPAQHLPSVEVTLGSIVVAFAGVVACVIHSQRQRQMARKQRETQRHYLQDKLLEEPQQKEIRIFMDGAFDLLHYGHMNAFRLARSLGTHLIVGVNSDVSITQCKGAPLMNDQERLDMVAACKFVDQVIPNCPYIMSKEYLEHVIEKYKIDFVVHGSDPCIVDGKDVYATAKQAGKYRSIPRTEGVSTTDIVGRMLLLTKEHHCHCQVDGNKSSLPAQGLGGTKAKLETTTSQMLKLFSAGVTAPTKDMRVVYVDGAWDLFHPGHVAFLKVARERGDYLIVGIHGDDLVNQMRGMNLPLMNLNERVLSVLGCKYVSNVVIDAPFSITPDMISSLNISEVVHGSNSDDMGKPEDEKARFGHAIRAGIYTVIPSPSSFNMRNIVSRIQKNQETFQRRFESKIEAENRFYHNNEKAS